MYKEANIGTQHQSFYKNPSRRRTHTPAYLVVLHKISSPHKPTLYLFPTRFFISLFSFARLS
jgi:hypothetical protein